MTNQQITLDEEEEEQQGQQQQGIEDHDHNDHDEEGDHEQIEMGVLGLPQPHQDEHLIHEEQGELQSVHSVEKEHESEPAMCVIEVTAVRRGNRRGIDDLSPQLPANTQEGARKRSFFRKFSAFGQKEEKKREVQAGSDKTKKDIGDDHGECQPLSNQGYYTRSKAARRKQTPVQHVSSV